MAKSVMSKIGRTSKRAVIGVIRGTGDIAESVLEATRDMLLVTGDSLFTHVESAVALRMQNS